MSETIIDLLRHGEPQGGSMYRGHSIDDPLSEAGWKQMRSAVENYSDWDNIVSSPLLRCKSFSEELAKKLNIPLQIEYDFKEVGFGTWEGLSREQVKQRNLKEYTDFYEDPVLNRPEESENLEDFKKRVVDVYRKVVLENQNKKTLIVAHAGVIRAILAETVDASLNGMYHFKIDNACFSRVNISKNNLIFCNHSSIY